jgi:Domain of unknown function (DUF1707)
MDTDARGFPLGALRASDADRDRALSELAQAHQIGRITADEFDERSAQVLAARTGQQLSALLADLPVDHALAGTAPAGTAPAGAAPAGSALAGTAAVQRTDHAPASRLVIGASLAAICFAALSVASAMSRGPDLQQREWAQKVMASHGMPGPVPPALGFNWVGTITPGAIAVLLVVLIIFLHRTRTIGPSPQ